MVRCKNTPEWAAKREREKQEAREHNKRAMQSAQVADAAFMKLLAHLLCDRARSDRIPFF